MPSIVLLVTVLSFCDVIKYFPLSLLRGSQDKTLISVVCYNLNQNENKKNDIKRYRKYAISYINRSKLIDKEDE